MRKPSGPLTRSASALFTFCTFCKESEGNSELRTELALVVISIPSRIAYNRLTKALAGGALKMPRYE
jgi:hypothetical protein